MQSAIHLLLFLTLLAEPTSQSQSRHSNIDDEQIADFTNFTNFTNFANHTISTNFTDFANFTNHTISANLTNFTAPSGSVYDLRKFSNAMGIFIVGMIVIMLSAIIFCVLHTIFCQRVETESTSTSTCTSDDIICESPDSLSSSIELST